MPTLKTIDKDTLKQAAAILGAGGIVAIPTETVYGLAGNALDGTAIAKIYEAKGRPSFNPLIVHCADVAQAQVYAHFDDTALALAARFWPGPLTFILPRRKGCGISELVTAGLDTIAVRVPAHPAARELIAACGFPLAAPSANKSGTVSSTTPAHVAQQFGDEIDMILAGGKTTVGLESTVLDLTGKNPVILRPGAISAEDIKDATGGLECAYHFETTSAPKSPGQSLRHYAPSVPLRLNAVDVRAGEALLAFGSLKFMGVQGGGFAKDMNPDSLRNLSESGDLHEAASNLFAMLKELDKPENAGGIAVMNIPDMGLGIAINDRLRRAAESGRV